MTNGLKWLEEVKKDLMESSVSDWKDKEHGKEEKENSKPRATRLVVLIMGAPIGTPVFSFK